MNRFAESVVENASIAWLESIGHTVMHGLEIAHGELAAERDEFGQVVLEPRDRAVHEGVFTT